MSDARHQDTDAREIEMDKGRELNDDARYEDARLEHSSAYVNRLGLVAVASATQMKELR